MSSDGSAPIEGDEGAALFEWAIGPIEGITTAWHEVPREITIPVGTTVRFKCGVSASADVVWNLAPAVRPTRSGSIASYHFGAPGRYEISAVIESDRDGHGTGKKRPAESVHVAHSCLVIAVPAAAKPVVIESLEPRVGPLLLTESSSNFETMRVFFNGYISPLRQVGPDAYRTSVGRPISLDVALTDPRFAALVETRISGQRPVLGTSEIRVNTPGAHTVSVGPPDAPVTFTLETFAVEITSHHEGREIVYVEVPTTFEARTDPPGYEDEITWIASTKYGEAHPVVGHGATFTVEFRGARAADSWLGVRADNAAFGQDGEAYITDFSPTTLAEGGALTVHGGNFPMNSANMSLEFLHSSLLFVPVLGLSVIDTNFDGLGDTITGTIGPFPSELVGLSIPLTLYLGTGTVGPGTKLFHFTVGTDFSTQSVQAALVGQQAADPKFKGDFNNTADEISFDFAAFSAWMANKTYYLTGTINIRYTLAGKTYHCKFEAKGNLFSSDANPTAEECAQATATIYQSAANLADDADELKCKDNFEVKVVGKKVVVAKKVGSTANMIDGTAGEFTLKCQ